MLQILLRSMFLSTAILGVALAPGVAKATDEPREHTERMQWWRDGKFGMFIHWGLYSVPAGEWKGKKAPGLGEWIMNNAKIPVSEYEPLQQQFNPTKFDANAWVKIAKHAGVKYIVITSKHHDGFCLFDSEHTNYDIMGGPFKRDLLKELSDACHREGIKICWYHSIMDWHHPESKGATFPKYRDVMKAQIRELLTKYGPIGVMWFDGEWIPEWNQEQGRELLAFCRSIQPSVIVNNRVGKRAQSDGDFGTPEQFIPATGIPGHDWESCMTMNETWGFRKDDHDWKPTQTLLRNLVDITSKGGNFLLNVGPTSEGLIPQPSVDRLAEIGKWMAVNSESIYGTKPSPFKRLAFGRCTQKEGKLFLHVFDWPKEGRLEVGGLANEVKRAYLLAAPEQDLPVSRSADKTIVKGPATAPDAINTVVVLEFDGWAKVDPSLRQGPDGVVVLPSADAVVLGSTAKYLVGKGVEIDDFIGNWSNPKDAVQWDFLLDKAGRYSVELVLASDKGDGGSSIAIKIGDREVSALIPETGGPKAFQTVPVGVVALDATGKLTVTVTPKNKKGKTVVNLRAINLRPAD